MRALAAGVIVAVCGCAAAYAVGQPPAKQPTVAETRTAEARAALQKAIDDAKGANKVLLVTFGTDAGRVKANEQLLAVPATAAWIARHATTHSVADQKLVSELSPAGIKQVAGADPLFFTDGLMEPVDKRGSSIVASNTPKSDPKTVTGQGSLALAMRLDWTLRSPMFSSASFRARHDATLKPVPFPGSAGDKAPPLLPALNAARLLAKEKKWDQAANAYANAWWETSGSVTATPIRVGAMAAEMALIAEQSPGAKDRLTGLRTEYARAMDVSDMRQVHEYLILCRVLGDHEHNLKFLDEATQARSSASLLPATDLLAIDWMMPVCHWNDPNEGVNKPSAWCVQLMRQCDKLAARKDGPPMTSAVEYGRWLARVESSRRLAWLLVAGKEDKATELRDSVIAADGSPEMKRSLVAACLASGQKRPWMNDLLKGIDDPELAAELKK